MKIEKWLPPNFLVLSSYFLLQEVVCRATYQHINKSLVWGTKDVGIEAVIIDKKCSY